MVPGVCACACSDHSHRSSGNNILQSPLTCCRFFVVHFSSSRCRGIAIEFSSLSILISCVPLFLPFPAMTKLRRLKMNNTRVVHFRCQVASPSHIFCRPECSHAVIADTDDPDFPMLTCEECDTQFCFDCSMAVRTLLSLC